LASLKIGKDQAMANVIKSEIRRILKEVVEATETHRQVVSNNLHLKARIGKGTLEDMELGMSISISKLVNVLKSLKSLK
jgi:hypothetical protein